MAPVPLSLAGRVGASACCNSMFGSNVGRKCAIEGSRRLIGRGFHVMTGRTEAHKGARAFIGSSVGSQQSRGFAINGHEPNGVNGATQGTRRKGSGAGQVVVITSGKGGVGKTTTAASMAYGLANEGFR
jgi:hypothetical protein